MTPQSEFVVLVGQDGTPIGSSDKATVHTYDTPLHLAFSCHVFNPAGQVLVTRRALSKKTWPGVWSNSFCGHPGIDEDAVDAIVRRARDELAITLTNIEPLLPDFRYRAVDASGIVENEICPVYTAVTTDEPTAQPDEIAEYAWVNPAEFQRAVAGVPFAFSPWVGWQLAELAALDKPYQATIV